MAASLQGALGRLRRDGFEHLLPSDRFEQLCCQTGHTWRRRLFTPALTLRLFLLQVLHGNIAINALRQLAGLSFAAASYCQARGRLPLVALQQLLMELTDAARPLCRRLTPLPNGTQVYVVDGSGWSMPDTRVLRRRFGLPPPAQVGVSYPVGMVLGLLDLASGLFVRAAAFPLLVKDARGVLAVHEALHAGDILVGDRAFCSYPHIALLLRRGVHCCFRLHQSRLLQRGIVRWSNGRHRPRGIGRRLFATLPAELTVRIVHHHIRRKGYRTKVVLLVTTLLDQHAWPEQRLAELYRRRWEIETCFAHLKTTMGMDVLKCKRVDGVLKELAVYLIVYNLVRLVMLRWALLCGVPPRRVSFIDALRLLCVRGLGLSGVTRLIINPDRSGRRQLRVRRRRLKHFSLLNRPRHQYQEANHYRRPR